MTRVGASLTCDHEEHLIRIRTQRPSLESGLRVQPVSGLSPLLVRDLGSTLDYDGLVMGHNESTKKVTLHG